MTAFTRFNIMTTELIFKALIFVYFTLAEQSASEDERKVAFDQDKSLLIGHHEIRGASPRQDNDTHSASPRQDNDTHSASPRQDNDTHSASARLDNHDTNVASARQVNDTHSASPRQDNDTHSAIARQDNDTHSASARLDNHDTNVASARQVNDTHSASARQDNDTHSAIARQDNATHSAIARQDNDTNVASIRQDQNNDTHGASSKQDKDTHGASARQSKDTNVARDRQDQDTHGARNRQDQDTHASLNRGQFNHVTETMGARRASLATRNTLAEQLLHKSFFISDFYSRRLFLDPKKSVNKYVEIVLSGNNSDTFISNKPARTSAVERDISGRPTSEAYDSNILTSQGRRRRSIDWMNKHTVDWTNMDSGDVMADTLLLHKKDKQNENTPATRRGLKKKMHTSNSLGQSALQDTSEVTDNIKPIKISVNNKSIKAEAARHGTDLSYKVKRPKPTESPLLDDTTAKKKYSAPGINEFILDSLESDPGINEFILDSLEKTPDINSTGHHSVSHQMKESSTNNDAAPSTNKDAAPSDGSTNKDAAPSDGKTSIAKTPLRNFGLSDLALKNTDVDIDFGVSKTVNNFPSSIYKVYKDASLDNAHDNIDDNIQSEQNEDAVGLDGRQPDITGRSKNIGHFLMPDTVSSSKRHEDPIVPKVDMTGSSKTHRNLILPQPDIVSSYRTHADLLRLPTENVSSLRAHEDEPLFIPQADILINSYSHFTQNDENTPKSEHNIVESTQDQWEEEIEDDNKRGVYVKNEDEADTKMNNYNNLEESKAENDEDEMGIKSLSNAVDHYTEELKKQQDVLNKIIQETQDAEQILLTKHTFQDKVVSEIEGHEDELNRHNFALLQKITDASRQAQLASGVQIIEDGEDVTDSHDEQSSDWPSYRPSTDKDPKLNVPPSGLSGMNSSRKLDLHGLPARQQFMDVIKANTFSDYSRTNIDTTSIAVNSSISNKANRGSEKLTAEQRANLDLRHRSLGNTSNSFVSKHHKTLLIPSSVNDSSSTAQLSRNQLSLSAAHSSLSANSSVGGLTTFVMPKPDNHRHTQLEIIRPENEYVDTNHTGTLPKSIFFRKITKQNKGNLSNGNRKDFFPKQNQQKPETEFYDSSDNSKTVQITSHGLPKWFMGRNSNSNKIKKLTKLNSQSGSDSTIQNLTEAVESFHKSELKTFSHKNKYLSNSAGDDKQNQSTGQRKVSMDKSIGPSESISLVKSSGPSEGISLEESSGPSEGISLEESSGPSEGTSLVESSGPSEAISLEESNGPSEGTSLVESIDLFADIEESSGHSEGNSTAESSGLYEDTSIEKGSGSSESTNIEESSGLSEDTSIEERSGPPADSSNSETDRGYNKLAQTDTAETSHSLNTFYKALHGTNLENPAINSNLEIHGINSAYTLHVDNSQNIMVKDNLINASEIKVGHNSNINNTPESFYNRVQTTTARGTVDNSMTFQEKERALIFDTPRHVDINSSTVFGQFSTMHHDPSGDDRQNDSILSRLEDWDSSVVTPLVPRDEVVKVVPGLKGTPLTQTKPLSFWLLQQQATKLLNALFSRNRHPGLAPFHSRADSSGVPTLAPFDNAAKHSSNGSRLSHKQMVNVKTEELSMMLDDSSSFFDTNRQVGTNSIEPQKLNNNQQLAIISNSAEGKTRTTARLEPQIAYLGKQHLSASLAGASHTASLNFSGIGLSEDLVYNESITSNSVLHGHWSFYSVLDWNKSVLVLVAGGLAAVLFALFALLCWLLKWCRYHRVLRHLEENFRDLESDRPIYLRLAALTGSKKGSQYIVSILDDSKFSLVEQEAEESDDGEEICLTDIASADRKGPLSRLQWTNPHSSY